MQSILDKVDKHFDDFFRPYEAPLSPQDYKDLKESVCGFLHLIKMEEKFDPLFKYKPGDLEVKKPPLLVDFDGTIVEYTPNSFIENFIITEEDNTILSDCVEILRELQKTFTIIIYSGRCNTYEGYKAVEDYLKIHLIPYDSIYFMPKPIAYLMIDDRCLHFKGSWKETYKEILKYKNWIDEKRFHSGDKRPS